VEKIAPAEVFFIILVDGIFTTLFGWLFTNLFDDCANASESLRVSRMQRRLTPSQPKFDTNKKDRIARMYWGSIACVALRERIDVAVA
jgi:hypothetical protein